MELKAFTKSIKCDTPGCKNRADYVLDYKKYLGMGNVYYCKECLKKMYAEFGKVLVPPSIQNVYKKNNKKEN